MPNIDLVEGLGLLAGAQTTLAFLPQALKVWRSKSAHDISLATFLMFCGGVSCWLAYGLLIDSLSIVVANALTLALAFSILVMKLRYDRPRKPHESNADA